MVKIKKNARGVLPEKCFGCGACFDACPVKVKNEFEQGLSQRGAIYVPFSGALPNVPVIDKENCLHAKGQMCEACQQACPFEAIDLTQKDEIIQIKVGGIVIATGFSLFDCRQIPNLGYGQLPDVYTSLEFERMVNSSGPTSGKILLKNGKPPSSVAIIHCVGSRSKEFNPYCSSVCCTYAAKFAHLIKENVLEAKVYDLFAERCLPGKGSQELFLSAEGVNLIRIQEPNDIEIVTSNDQLSLSYKDISDTKANILVDMVILAPSIIPNKDTDKITQLFELSRDKYGFLAEEHSKLNPVGTTTRGVFIAGCAQYPKDIESSVAEGKLNLPEFYDTVKSFRTPDITLLTSREIRDCWQRGFD